MRALADVKPTPEQLKIVSRNRPGTEVIRGAAGSGKTTTALLRLRSLASMFVNRKRRQQDDDPVRILVLTFNRTLRGYIEHLARHQVQRTHDVTLEISTFAKWARSALRNPLILRDSRRTRKIHTLGSRLELERDFLLNEVDYVASRFMPEKLKDYLTSRRHGRGISPRVERSLRQAILTEVIGPYQEWKKEIQVFDWNDLAVALARRQLPNRYDIIIADETQDFSANQIRAVKNQLAGDHSLTLIVDTSQRIYARGFAWQEAGITVRPGRTWTLERNYRNTKEIAAFAAPLLKGIPIDEDGAIPNLANCEKHGPQPIVLKGKFADQTNFVVNYIRKDIDLEEEAVAVLHPLGGGWFSFIKSAFARSGLQFVEITRESEWPQGDENIALSTMHSAKGLEFDHVIIVGLNEEVTPHGESEDDDRLTMLRRLLAMAIARARKSVILGYKPEDASQLVGYLNPATYNGIEV